MRAPKPLRKLWRHRMWIVDLVAVIVRLIALRRSRRQIRRRLARKLADRLAALTDKDLDRIGQARKRPGRLEPSK